jgi:hypothetical protein
MFSQDLFMSSLSFTFSKPVLNLNLILFPTLQFTLLPEIKSLYIELLCYLCTYCQYRPNFRNHQIVINITVNSHDRLYILYTRVLYPICKYVISPVVSHPIRRRAEFFMKVSVREHHAYNIYILCFTKVTIITPLLLLSWCRLSFPIVVLKI